MGTVLFDISFRFYGVISYYFHSIIDFTNPLSILFSKIFFNTISIIGPTNNPNTPQNLNPVYIATSVNIGWTPNCPLTIFGSIICLITDIINHNTNIAIPNVRSPLQADIIAQGTITVPEPSIGNASINPIPNAARSGYFILKPTQLYIYNPIKEIMNDTSINIAWAFKYPPNDLAIPFT